MSAAALPLLLFTGLQTVTALILLGILGTMAAVLLSMYLDVPFVPTRTRYYPAIRDALALEEGDVMYDLGCGSGRMLVYLGKQFPSTRFVGVERNLLLYHYGRLYARFAGARNVSIRRQNIFETDLRDATNVYAYLLPAVMESLAPKFETELHGARLASRAFLVPNKQPSMTIALSKKPGFVGEHLLYVYHF